MLWMQNVWSKCVRQSASYHSWVTISNADAFLRIPQHQHINGSTCTWGPFHTEFRSLWLKSCENLFFNYYYYYYYDVSIRSQFCTCHNNPAVMTCAKLWPYLTIFFLAQYKQHGFLSKIWIMSSWIFMKWIPGKAHLCGAWYASNGSILFTWSNSCHDNSRGPFY